MSTSTKWLHQAIIFLFFFVIIATPLIWVPDNSELFEYPKMIFVYASTLAILTLWATRCILDRKFYFKRTPFDPVIVAFLVSQIISTVFSIHLRTSLFGYYSRFHGGLLSTATYILLFYAFVTHFNSKTVKWFILALLISLGVSSVYAFPEHFGYAISCLSVHDSLVATCWVQDIVNRVFGTFGQPNWLAAFIITLFPLTWSSLTTLARNQKLKSLTLYLLQFFSFSVLLFTRSKSGLIGFAAGYFIYWGISIARRRRVILPHLFFSSLIISFTLIVFGSEYTPSISRILSLPPLTTSNPASTATQPQSGTVLESGDISLPGISRGAGTQSSTIREIVWRGATQVFLHHPLFGTGVETFGYSYYNYRPVDHNLVSEWDFIYNKAHNEFLNFAATSGIFGLVTYISLILAFIYLARPLNRKSSPRSEFDLQNTALISGFTALAISNFFGFSTVPVGVLFFLFPAITLASRTRPESTLKTKIKSLTSRGSSQPSPYQISALVFVGLCSSYLYYHLGKAYWADITYAHGKTSEATGQISPAINYYQQAVKLAPSEPTYTNDLADALAKAAQIYANQEHLSSAQQAASQAINYAGLTLKLNPVHLNFYKTQAGVFIRLSSLNPDFLDQAQIILEEAEKLAPTDAKITYNLGLIYLDQEKLDQAKAAFERTVSQKSNYEAARMQLADLYQQSGELDQARSQYQYILNYIAPGNTQAREALDTLSQD